MTAINEPLIPVLRPLGRRLRLRDSHQLAIRTLWLPLLATALVLLTGRLTPLPHYDRWAAVPLMGWTVILLAYSLLRPMPPRRVARRTDQALGLKDRLATALELTGPAAAKFTPDLVMQQQADALRAAHGIDPHQAFPLRWPRRPLTLAAVCLAASLLLLYLPNPMDAVLEERAAVAEEAERQAEALEELAADLTADESLDPDEREELLRQLREAAQALREHPGDREDLLAELARLDERLRRQLDPQHAARQAALEGLTADLADLAGATDADPSLEEAARLLQELAAGATEMSAADQERLAASLEEAAARLAGSDPTLARSLGQLAQSVRGGQPAALSADAAAQALSAAASDAALQQALAQALNRTQGSTQAIAQAGRESTQGQGQGQGQGDGQGQGQSPGQGQGQGQGQGTQGSGGGTTSPTGPPGIRPGRAGEPTDPNKPYQVGELDAVFAPWQQGQPGDPNFLPGRQTGQGEETVREGQQPQPGTPGAALVPYSEVYASYSTAAAQAMEREYIPAGLKDYVREYFTRLEP